MGDFADDGYYRDFMIHSQYMDRVKDTEKELKQYLHIVKEILDCFRIYIIKDSYVGTLKIKLFHYGERIRQLTTRKMFNSLCEELQNKALTTLHEIDMHINIADISKDIFNGIED